VVKFSLIAFIPGIDAKFTYQGKLSAFLAFFPGQVME
jgi:hypothetical protein